MWTASSTPIDPIRLQPGPYNTSLRHSDGMGCCRCGLLDFDAWC